MEWSGVVASGGRRCGWLRFDASTYLIWLPRQGTGRGLPLPVLPGRGDLP
ncbi:UNVERIFIED_CONTAM: hypothetical protein Sradi_0680700 [Sesamum radiatum]|uniref:Uncharacterized protein n=1 Tax=Sesamum radiatum TaxID=300843 RepID=A0AAW2VR30_SESRA